MPDDPTIRLFEKELDRQAAEQINSRRDVDGEFESVRAEVKDVRAEVKDVPALRSEVQMLKETVRANTTVMYALVGLLISSGAATALLKGLI